MNIGTRDNYRLENLGPLEYIGLVKILHNLVEFVQNQVEPHYQLTS